MTGVQLFNAGTIAVIITAAVGLVRLQVAEWRATKVAAPTSKVERHPRVVSEPPPVTTQSWTNWQQRRDRPSWHPDYCNMDCCWERQ